MNIESYYIPGTTRRRIICDNGTELQRQFVYMQDHQWENLKKLARLQRASGSQVIGRLIDLAATGLPQPR